MQQARLMASQLQHWTSWALHLMLAVSQPLLPARQHPSSEAAPAYQRSQQTAAQSPMAWLQQKGATAKLQVSCRRHHVPAQRQSARAAVGLGSAQMLPTQEKT